MPRVPDRSELRLRVGISVIGLVLLGVAAARHGVPNAAALAEIFAVAGLFFGVTLARALRALARTKDDD